MFHAFNFIHVYYYFEFIGNFIHKISSWMWSYSSIYRHLWFLWSIHEKCFVHSISFMVDIYIRFCFIHVVNFLSFIPPPPHFSLWTNNNMIFACPLMFPCNSQQHDQFYLLAFAHNSILLPLVSWICKNNKKSCAFLIN